MTREILIIDDEADIRTLIAGILHDEGYETRDAADSDEALAALSARRPTLVILDIWLQNSGLDGLELLKVIKREEPGLPIVVISGHGTIETAVAAIKLGAYDFVEKPFKSDRLLLVMERAIEAAQLRQENEELKLRAGPETELIGTSAAIQQLRHAIDKVAPTGSRVLITGPAGVGKEVVARTLHTCSRRHSGPFAVLNCAAVRPEHLELALFGCAAGVESPDAPGRLGMIERAHGGTLLLDEVADMPRETQGKIVRVLQENAFERVGSDVRVEVNVRVIASSSRDLEGYLANGRLRQDLYYRLNVVPLAVPPLSHRREDIPDLIRYFMARAADGAGLPPREITEDAIATLQAYEWPGNVRQLRNVIDWILIMAPGNYDEPVGSDMLPPDVGSIAPTFSAGEGATEMMSLPLREARGIFERRYLEAQVMRFGGNISRTATFVGMERSALHRKLRSLGINASDR